MVNNNKDENFTHKAIENKGSGNEHYDKLCLHYHTDLPIEKYVNVFTPINFKCSKGHVYKQHPRLHLRPEGGCPICKEQDKKILENKKLPRLFIKIIKFN